MTPDPPTVPDNLARVKEAFAVSLVFLPILIRDEELQHHIHDKDQVDDTVHDEPRVRG